MSNTLGLLDQAAFDVGRATGSSTVLQCVWVYHRPVDFEGLRRFHSQLQRGRLSRRIERSPLPFARDRWVAHEESTNFEIVAPSRPRTEFDRWLAEQLRTPLDCERGPGWHLAALPFSDGGAGVSLVISHLLIDAVGLSGALADAALGRADPVGWPAAASRRWWHAIREDTRQVAQDIPAIGRAVFAALRLARHNRVRTSSAAPRTTRSPASPGEAEAAITVPVATIFVDADEWSARAQSLGGTNNTLLVGLAARLAQRTGHNARDGSVGVLMPVNERADNDTRANAISSVNVTVDPAHATTDLNKIRAAVKQSLIHHRQVAEDEQSVNALVPFLPKVVLRASSRATRAASSNCVGASNVGVIEPAANRPDGTDADSFAMRIDLLGETEATMSLSDGVQSLLSGIAHGQVFVSAISYRPHRSNSTDCVIHELLGALNDFSLSGRPL